MQFGCAILARMVSPTHGLTSQVTGCLKCQSGKYLHDFTGQSQTRADPECHIQGLSQPHGNMLHHTPFSGLSVDSVWRFPSAPLY